MKSHVELWKVQLEVQVLITIILITKSEPLNKFVYFNTSLCEYNVIFLYPDGEDGVIKQFDDYLNNYDDKEFPQELIKSKYGDSETYNVIFKPIEIDNKLLTCLRTCQYLGYMKYMDRDKFDTIKINSKKDLLDFAQKEKVEDNWIFTKNTSRLRSRCSDKN